MSDNMLEILRKLSNNPAIRMEIANAGSPAEQRAVITRICKMHHISPSPEQFKAAVVPPDGELSDAELESVVGGKTDNSSDDQIQGDNSTFANILEYFEIYESPAYNDKIEAGKGDDLVIGGVGSDTIYGGEGDDTLHGYGFRDGHEDSDGDDYLDGGAGEDVLRGDLGDDTLIGGTDNDRLYGGKDNDSLDGGSGNDILKGGTGNDTLSGGSGNDTLHGDTGNDVLAGGEGNDVFCFDKDDGTDTITDFDPDSDQFQFWGVRSVDDLDVSSSEGNTIINFGDTTVIVEGQEMTQEEVWARTRL